jgi:surfactin synthase thioesterase subunit
MICKPCLHSFLILNKTAFRPFEFPIHGYFAAKDRKISRVRTWGKWNQSQNFASPDQIMISMPLVLLLTFPLPIKQSNLQEMVEGWRKFTTSDFDVELVQGNHLFVYNANVRDSWFESITDLLTGEGF